MGNASTATRRRRAPDDLPQEPWDSGEGGRRTRFRGEDLEWLELPMHLYEEALVEEQYAKLGEPEVDEPVIVATPKWQKEAKA